MPLSVWSSAACHMKNSEGSGDVWLCETMTQKVMERRCYLYQKNYSREETVLFYRQWIWHGKILIKYTRTDFTKVEVMNLVNFLSLLCTASEHHLLQKNIIDVSELKGEDTATM